MLFPSQRKPMLLSNTLSFYMFGVFALLQLTLTVKSNLPAKSALGLGHLQLEGCVQGTISIVMTSMVMFIIMGASALAYLVTQAKLPMALTEFIMYLDLPGWLIIAAMCIVYLILGCFLEVLSMLVVTLPFFVPILTSFGYDLVWFGVVAVILNELGLVTPPYGLNLFVIQGARPTLVLKTLCSALCLSYF